MDTLAISVALLGILYALFAFRKFNAALLLFIIFLPSYLIRIKFFGLPSTALEVMFGFLLLAWIFKYLKRDRFVIKMFFVKHRRFALFYALFLLASFVSIFTSDMRWFSLGQWRAYFLQPMLLFLILIGRSSELKPNFFIEALSWSSLAVSSLAIIQKLFSFGLDDNGRALSFFTSPNSVGLYLAPIMVLVAGTLYKKISADGIKNKNLFYYSQTWFLVLSSVAVIFTRSLGTVAGLFGAFVLGLFIVKRRRAAYAMVLGLVISTIMVLSTSSLSLQKSQSFSNRFKLWGYAVEYLTDSPKNFVFGTGVRQFFRKIQKPHYNVKELERLIYPHNIFLNFWTETGLFGLIAFSGIFVSLLLLAKQTLLKDRITAAAMIGVLVVIFVHGIIDVPYFKNDLAMMFWFLAAYIYKESETI